MSARGLIALICLASIISCGKFVVSPYVSNTHSARENSKQLKNIQTQESSANDTFKIAVISDTHNYYDELKKQVDYINSRKAEYEFVIVGGDLTNLGLLREFEAAKSFLDDLEIPYVSVVGNHDLLSNGSSIFDQMFGPKNFAFTYRQTKFVLFNNNNWESSGRVPDLGYVESELASSTSMNHILVAHVSPEDDKRWTKEEKDEMRALVDTYNVDYFLNGHDHNPGEGPFGNATRVTIGASSKGKILEVNISNAGVSHQFVKF